MKHNSLSERSVPPLGEIFVKSGMLSEELLKDAREKSQRNLIPLESVLRSEKILTDELMEKAIEEQSRILLSAGDAEVKLRNWDTKKRELEEEKVERAVLLAARKAENTLIRNERRSEDSAIQSEQKQAADGPTLLRVIVHAIQTEHQKRKEQKRIAREETRRKDAEKQEEQMRKAAELEMHRKEMQQLQEEMKRKAMEEKKQKLAEVEKRREEEKIKRQMEREAQREKSRKQKEEQKQWKQERMKQKAEAKRKMQEMREAAHHEREKKILDQKAERLRKRMERQNRRLERRTSIMNRLGRIFSPRRKSHETAADEKYLIDEAKKEALRQVLIEHEKQRYQSGEQSIDMPGVKQWVSQSSNQSEPEARTTDTEKTISAVLVDSPEQVVVSAPRIITQNQPQGYAPQRSEPVTHDERESLLSHTRDLEEQLSASRDARVESAQAPVSSAMSDDERAMLLSTIEELKKQSQASTADLIEEQERIRRERELLEKEREKLLEMKGAAWTSAVSTERDEIETARKELDTEREKLVQERVKLEEGKMGEKEAADDAQEALAATKANFEKKLKEQELKFAEEKKELEKHPTHKNVGGGISKEDLEREKEKMKKEMQKEAAIAFEKERTEWALEKEKIRQESIAQAEAGFLTSMKGSGGLFGGGKRDALAKEIGKWQKETEKLAEERQKLEREKALHEEEQRMREEKRKVEEARIQLERQKVADEKHALSSEEEHEKTLADEKKQLAEEREELKAAAKAKKKKKKKKGEVEPEKKDESVDLGQILVAQNYLEQSEYETAKKSAEERNVTLDHVLREEGLLTKEIIQNAVAEYYHLPFVDVSANPPDTDIVELLPTEIALGMRATAIEKRSDGTLVVATNNPERSDELRAKILEAVGGIMGLELVYTTRDAIDAALAFYRKPLNTRFQSIIEQHQKIAPEIIEEIFADAIQLGASDIHFEPQEKTVVVRFRVDGVMHEAGKIPREYYEGIVNRIKIAGNMRIDEHYAAQDGAIRWKHGDKAMDVRVSIVPIVDGEKIVMRLLSEYVRTLTLRDLGFSPRHLDVLVKAAHKPFGMLLTTGPTGSGKSTTLYGLLKIRNSPDVNISTIEDPVEYKIPGINHIQVNVKANLTFERGLRALVRQDPDIILVGEIRDDITAQISVNAALTGHLLFSTLHANDAATAVPRLLEMGLESYLLASTLELIIAQRLMRRNCMKCRYSYQASQAEAQKLFTGAERYFTEDTEITLYKGKGCATCGGTGYKGRVGVYELLPVTPEIEEMITNRRTSGEINILARQQGMLTLFEDGLEKVLAGFSNIEELLRVAAPPDALASGPSINYATLLSQKDQ
ncbi:MAG TPA: ATPase, T2SS/T4P/T4SS family [Candidatus Peribacterales bacterium]|nr:ATPase, T2SS/T4P/T4SS family [Candidatus Peribacterales bacterium]